MLPAFLTHRTCRKLLSLLCLPLAAALLLARPPTASGAPVPPRRAPAAPVAPSAALEELFETRVRPLLAGRCSGCHGAARQQGGLRLDSRAGVLRGGSRGPAVLPGRPGESLLLRAVSHGEGAPKMPPDGRLSAAEMESLRLWIRAGAPWPAAAPPTKPEAPLWSVRPLTAPPVPAMPPELQRWVRTPVDAFVLRDLRRAGMRPAPTADARTLLRRATFGVTGLPPTPEAVRAFLRECEPGPAAADAAYERLVDRLLASPQYGERWARYWLDLARYADTNGYERDAEKPESWRYRDYVIRALNANKPYDRFITEQLAGDELPDRSEETVTATGFLRLGTWDDEPNDPVQYRYERLDDLVHATATAFLGLTVRCARCHDHKFDPIPQQDYYAFAAAFWGGYLEPGDGKLQGGPPPDRLGYPVLGFTDRGREAPPLRLLRNGDPRREEAPVPPGYLSLLAHLPPLRRTVTPPPPEAATTRRRLQLAGWIADPANPLTARVFVNRIWQGHFGTGLVRTPNNFGRKGSPPTHPELLDYLAYRFARGAPAGAENTADGAPPWSIKALHRLLLTSAVYRMSSQHPRAAEYARRDAANTRWWKFSRRRLDADALRDTLLAVSGELNPAMGGRGFTPAVSREALEGLSRKGAEWAPSPPAEQRRRSIYMFLKRALIPPFMTVFDFGDTTQPLEQRETGVVPTQALALLNNAFVHEQSRAMALRVRREAGTDAESQVERAWWLAFSRPPTARERAAARSYLRDPAHAGAVAAGADPPLASLCHALLNANELIYLD